MPRLPLPWSKKRGSRLAGDVFAGVVGEILLLAFVFLLGVTGVAAALASRFARYADVSLPTAAAAAEVPAGLGFWIFLLASIVLGIAGAVGLAYRLLGFGTSDERRAAIAQRTGALELVRRPHVGTQPLPNVPEGTILNESPGIRLAYRLPSTGSPGIRLAAAALLALLWVGTWLVLAVVALTGLVVGTPRPVLTCLLVPLGALGLWAGRYFLRQLREGAGMGATIVEISDNPLCPGETYLLYVAQYGNLRLRRLRIAMICEEETVFRQGTDVRTDRHEATAVVICDEKNVSIDPEGAWEREFEFAVPAGAMHSFQSAHNAVHWKVVVSGESRPWPSFSRSYPVVVHPPRGAAKRGRR